MLMAITLLLLPPLASALQGSRVATEMNPVGSFLIAREGARAQVTHPDVTLTLDALAQTQALGKVLPEGAIANPKGTLKLDACKPGGQWPKMDKLDLVISWWTNKPQSEYKTFQKSFIKQSFTVQNQAEIMYSLRSYEKYGLLDHVNQVFIMIDRDVLSQYGAPRFFDYNNKNIKVVSSEDLGLQAGGQWEKPTRMHTIPGLSDYFLYLPDDSFMMHQFDMSVLWSEDKHTPKLHEFGTWQPGWCDNHAATGSFHGPVLIQKCAMTAVMDRYLDGANQQSVISNAMQKNQPIDALCLFTRAMEQDWKSDGFDTDFQEECHTNGGCNPQSHALFMNIQGFQVSDEYANQPMSAEGNELMPEGPAKFFESKYPSPSRFESPGMTISLD